jgi:hypothetical protein
VSEGLTLTEEAALMESLGARTAMNLDGGGSTAIAVNGSLVNHTSDATGERPDGDFVVALPKAWCPKAGLAEAGVPSCPLPGRHDGTFPPGPVPCVPKPE